jgi:hypothetical protein
MLGEDHDQQSLLRYLAGGPGAFQPVPVATIMGSARRYVLDCYREPRSLGAADRALHVGTGQEAGAKA